MCWFLKHFNQISTPNKELNETAQTQRAKTQRHEAIKINKSQLDLAHMTKKQKNQPQKH